MKQIIRELLFVVLMACYGSTTWAGSYEIDGIYYILNGDTAIVTKSKNHSYKGDIVIPSTVTYTSQLTYPATKTYTVTAIDGYAFNECSSLTSITIPSSVKYIGYWAFTDCKNLKSATLPNSLVEMQQGAFKNCINLTSINIPASLTKLQWASFMGCSKLASITLPKGLLEIETSAFEGCKRLHILDVPETVTSIEDKAFNDCDSLIYICLHSKELSSSPYLDNTCMIYAHDNVWKQLRAEQAQKGYLVIGDSVGYSCKTTLSSVDVTFRKFKGVNGYNITDGSPVFEWMISNSDDSFVRVSGTKETEIEEFKKEGLMPGKEYVFKNFGYQVTVSRNGYFANKPFDVHCTTEQPTIEIQSYKTTYRTATCCLWASYLDDQTPSEVGVELNGERYAKPQYMDYIAISDLKPATNLYLKPYAIYGDSIYYGEAVTCTTTAPVFNYTIVETQQTSIAAKNISVSENEELTCTEKGLLYNDNYYKANSSDLAKVTGLFPGKTYYMYVYACYGDTTITERIVAKTADVEPTITYEVAPTSIKISLASDLSDELKITEQSLDFAGNSMPIDQRIFTGLEPNKKYSIRYSIKVEGNGESDYFTSSESVYTSDIILETLQPKVVSDDCCIAAATTNIADEETQAGFQWKKYDAPESLAPNEAFTVVCDGQMEGYIKNMQATYYQVRAFYKSAEDNYYYGEWVVFDQTDYSYFEPTVHTYEATNVTDNSADVRGYAMQGTDDVVNQGFEYWSESSSNSKAFGANSNSTMVVYATGQVMSATLKDLKSNTIYCCRAFVTTSKGTTYGEEISFTTDIGTGILSASSDDAVTNIEEYYDIQGRKLNSMCKGLNIIRYSDGTSKKVYKR